MTEINCIKGVRDGISEKIQLTEGATAMKARAGNDERTALLVKNDGDSACGIYVEPGDGLRSAIGGLLAAVQAGELRFLELDSMRFKHLSGAEKGCFTLRLCDPADGSKAFAGAAATMKFAVLML